jgi:hypothetical protein
LKAARRLLPRIKKEHPQLRFVLAVDNVYACGAMFALAKQLNGSYNAAVCCGGWRWNAAVRSGSCSAV